MCPPPPAHPASDAACRADTPLFAHPWSLVPDKQRRGNRNGRRVLRLHSVLPDPLPYVSHGRPAPAQSSPGAGGHHTLRQVPHGRDTSRAAARRVHGHPPRHGPTAFRRHGALPLEPRHRPCTAPKPSASCTPPGTGRRPRDDLPTTVTPRPGLATLFADPWELSQPAGPEGRLGSARRSRTMATARGDAASMPAPPGEATPAPSPPPPRRPGLPAEHVRRTSEGPTRSREAGQPTTRAASAPPLQESTHPRTLHSSTFKTKTPTRAHAFISQSMRRAPLRCGAGQTGT